jgi:hypothetical protein
MEIKININGRELSQDEIESMIGPIQKHITQIKKSMDREFEEPFPWFSPMFNKFGFHNFLSTPYMQSFPDFKKKSEICNRLISNGLRKQKKFSVPCTISIPRRNYNYVLKTNHNIIISQDKKEDFKKSLGWDELTFQTNCIIKYK